MANCNKTKFLCGNKTYATCVQYELELPTYSSLTDEPCVTVEEVIDDLYGTVGDIKEDINLSELGNLCLSYVSGSEVNSVKKVLLKYEEEICTLKAKVEVLETEAICTKNISLCDINLTDLEDQCNNPITNLQQLLQYLLTKVNE